MIEFPLTTDTTHWYAGYECASAVVILALALYATKVSLGGRRVFDPEVVS